MTSHSVIMISGFIGVFRKRFHIKTLTSEKEKRERRRYVKDRQKRKKIRLRN